NLSGAGLGGPSTTTCANGNFSVDVTFNAGDGVKNIMVSQTDAAGNSASDNRDFIRDNMGPDIQITAPAVGTMATTGVRLEGICENGFVVRLTGTGLSSPMNTNCVNGHFAADILFSSGDG